MNERKPHIIKRISKVAFWVIIGLLITLTAIRFSLKSSFVRNLAKSQVEQLGSSYLNGTLSIESIDGDLGGNFTLNKLRISQDDTVMSLQNLEVHYKLFDLLKGQFTATDIHLSGLNVFIREQPDRSLNIQTLVKETESTTETTDGGSFGFGIDIQQLRVSNSSVNIQSATYLPDSTLKVIELSLSSSFSYFEEISASLSHLTFQVIEGSLPEPIRVNTSANFSEQTITLNELLVGTGESFLQTEGVLGLNDSTLNAKLTASPFYLKDLQPILDQTLANEEIELGLSVKGKFDRFTIDVLAKGTSFKKLEVTSDFTYTNQLILKKAGLLIEDADIASLTQNQINADFSDLLITAEGNLSDSISAANLTWGFTINNIRYEDYRIETFFGSGTLKNDEFLGNVQISDGEDTVILYPEITNITGDVPIWRLPVFVQHIDLSWWLKNPALKSDISLKMYAEGKGFELSDNPWNYRIFPARVGFSDVAPFQSKAPHFTPDTKINNDTLVIGNQRINNFNIQGSITEDSVSTAGFLQPKNSKIDFKFQAAQFLGSSPNYTFGANTKKFDLRDISGFEDTPTSINLSVNGSGQYFDFENLNLKTELDVDSSYINGALIKKINIDAGLRNQVLTISEGLLNSEMIEGSFSGQRNLVDQSDPENDIKLDFNIKNLQPLAPWTGAEIFNAKGKITGTVTELSTQKLLFKGRVELNDVIYDTLFTAKSIIGNTQFTLNDHYSYGFSLEVKEPSYSGFNLQDILLSASGVVIEDSLSGDFELNVESADAGQLLQSGTYEFDTSSGRVHMVWHSFDFQTPVSQMQLQAPFNFYYSNNTIKTDTLKLLAASGTYLNLAIPFADSLNQEVWVRGQDFNFGVIQEILLDERFVDGVLSGRLTFSQSPDEFKGDGAFSVTNLVYKNTEIDEFNLNFKIASERLTAFMNVMLDGKEKISGNLNLPFIAKDPSTYEDAFYDEPVSAKLKVNPVALSEFETLLKDFEITNTRGNLSVNIDLSGTVREPNLDGSLQLGQPSLSGIAVDTAFAEFQYHHLEEKITAIAQVNTHGQKAASIKADLPFAFDFVAMKMLTPDETDSLHFNMLTDNFNLSVFNDFLNKQYLSKLRGFLNANINISGTPNNLQSSGYLRLDNSSVSVPIAGITLTGISSEMSFSPNTIQLNSFKVNSGSGTFNASGNIDLEGMYPTNLNLSTNAYQFRAANTSDYNVIIDLNSRITGKPFRPKASGNLTVKNGFIYLQDFGEKSVEAVELEDEDQSSFSPYDSLAIDMQFIIEEGFQIRNRRYLDMEIEINGELEAQKQTNGDLQLFGALYANEGYVRPLGKNFTLDEGVFSFSGPLVNPEINIKASYIPQTTQKQMSPITLYYVIEGTAQEPTFRFESDPQMEQQNIVCYTLFNKPCYALESWQQAISGSGGTSPADLLVDVLLDEVESLATRQLGIDVVQIDNTRSASGSATSIKTGWYLNRRTFFAVVNEISGSTPKTLFILEYLLNQNWDLILTQGDDNRQGVDIRWHYDY